MRASLMPEPLETRRLLSTAQTFIFDGLPPAGITAAGQEVPMGGFAARRRDGSNRIVAVKPKPASRRSAGRDFLHVLWDSLRISF